MAIHNVILWWLERLKARDAFRGTAVLELGPSTITASADYLDRYFEATGAAPIGTARGIYAAAGLSDYESLDFIDARATHKADLNKPLDLGKGYDAVASCGTLEHIFNIAQAFATVHDHIKTGGCAVHVVPAAGDYDHGFYNIHETLFRDLARANDYEVIDYLYVPNHHGQNLWLAENISAVPVVVDLEKGSAPRGGRIPAANYGQWADYLFVCYRKTSAGPFVIPQQGVYS